MFSDEIICSLDSFSFSLTQCNYLLFIISLNAFDVALMLFFKFFNEPLVLAELLCKG